MINKIQQICKNLEEEKGIEIIFAVENGSRVWGVESKDSDYDVRFVYKYPQEEYLKINRPKDNMRKMVDDIDLVGFDWFKFMGLLIKSNPSCIEWLQSDIFYYGNKVAKDYLLAVIKEQFNPEALFYPTSIPLPVHVNSVYR